MKTSGKKRAIYWPSSKEINFFNIGQVFQNMEEEIIGAALVVIGLVMMWAAFLTLVTHCR